MKDPDHRDLMFAELLAEVRALRAEVALLRELFDEFFSAFLNSKFQFGQPDDRWRRRR